MLSDDNLKLVKKTLNQLIIVINKNSLVKVSVTRHLQTMIFTGCLIFITVHLWSQPYFDPLQIRYTYALRNNSSKGTPFTHLWIGSDIPIPIRKDTLYTETNTIHKIDTTILILSPTFD